MTLEDPQKTKRNLRLKSGFVIFYRLRPIFWGEGFIFLREKDRLGLRPLKNEEYSDSGTVDVRKSMEKDEKFTSKKYFLHFLISLGPIFRASSDIFVRKV